MRVGYHITQSKIRAQHPVFKPKTHKNKKANMPNQKAITLYDLAHWLWGKPHLYTDIYR